MEAPMPNELKPCPFCESELIKCDASPIYGVSYVHPRGDCLFAEAIFWEHTGALKVWKNRPIEDALQARIEQIEIATSKISEIMYGYPDNDSAECILDNIILDIPKLKETAEKWLMAKQEIDQLKTQLNMHADTHDCEWVIENASRMSKKDVRNECLNTTTIKRRTRRACQNDT
jgi:hypothetical protein